MAANADVAIIGAGPCGLSAARTLAEAGLAVAQVEARDRVGGRSWSVDVQRWKGVDFGAHWLHAKRANPLTAEARRLGIGLRSADRWPIVIDGDEILGTSGQQKLWRAWRRVDGAIVRLAKRDPDAPASRAVDRSDRWQVLAGELHGTHACGAPLSEVSAADFANVLDSEDRFVNGGLGALVAAAGQGTAPHLGVRAECISLAAEGVRIATSEGVIEARAVLVTVPTTLLAQDTIRFEPGLPLLHRRAVEALPHGAYERLVFTLADDPFMEDRDRAVILLSPTGHSFYMLAGGGGYGLHFADFGGPEAKALATAGVEAMAEVVRDWLDKQVGSEAAASLKPIHASGWSHDPLTLGAWSLARPGRVEARAELRMPIEGRIWIAGEATSLDQWGTVGGAWLEGARAAHEIIKALRGACHWTRLPSMLGRGQPTAPARGRASRLT